MFSFIHQIITFFRFNARALAESSLIRLDKLTITIIRECVCTAITRVALRLGNDLQHHLKVQLGVLLIELLSSDDHSVIINTVIGIRSLSEEGSYRNSENETFNKINEIIQLPNKIISTTESLKFSL